MLVLLWCLVGGCGVLLVGVLGLWACGLVGSWVGVLSFGARPVGFLACVSCSFCFVFLLFLSCAYKCAYRYACGCCLGVWGAVFVCVCVVLRGFSVFGCPYRYGGIARYGRMPVQCLRGYLLELVCRHGVCAVLPRCAWTGAGCGWVWHRRA